MKHEIHLSLDSPLPNIGLYRQSIIKASEVKKQLQLPLEHGVIRLITSPCGSRIIILPKKDGIWRMCIDYMALNKITLKIDDLLDQLQQAKDFTKLDLKFGYHQVRVKEEDIWKTPFKTRQGLYEWLVMPFGLCNAPTTFMRLMNNVLETLKKHQLLAKLKKCEFVQQPLVYLGYVIGGEELKIDPAKMEVIMKWLVPSNVFEVKSFIGAT
eukprot:PITA_05416